MPPRTGLFILVLYELCLQPQTVRLIEGETDQGVGPGTHFEHRRLFLVVTFEMKVSAGQAIFRVKSCFMRGVRKIKGV